MDAIEFNGFNMCVAFGASAPNILFYSVANQQLAHNYI